MIETSGTRRHSVTSQKTQWEPHISQNWPCYDRVLMCANFISELLGVHSIPSRYFRNVDSLRCYNLEACGRSGSTFVERISIAWNLFNIPILINGSDVWAIRKMDEWRLTWPEMKFLRKTAGSIFLIHYRNALITEEPKWHQQQNTYSNTEEIGCNILIAWSAPACQAKSCITSPKEDVQEEDLQRDGGKP